MAKMYESANARPKEIVDSHLSYRQDTFRTYIVPNLRNYILASLRKDMVQCFVNGLADKKLKSITIERIEGTLKTAVMQAIDND